jgi:endonuclease III
MSVNRIYEGCDNPIAMKNGTPLYPPVEEVMIRLIEEFGRPTLGNKKNAFNELLYIILSLRTQPMFYQENYRALRSVYRRADSLVDSSPDDLSRLIHRGGLQNQKAHNIVIIANRLKKAFGRVTLTPLANMTDNEAEDFLLSLPGVSKKVARCVMMYSFNRHVFPVDSNCFRIAQRLGWLCNDLKYTDRLADELQENIPTDMRHDLHVGMVTLGRIYCLPKDTHCAGCPLFDICLVTRDIKN